VTAKGVEKIMTEIRVKKMLIYLSVIFLLLLVVLYIYLVQPVRAKAIEMEQNLVTKRLEYKALQAKTGKIAVTPDLDWIKLEAVRRQVPEQPYVETIVRDLRRLEVVSRTQLKQYHIEVGTAAGKTETSKTETSKGETNTQVSKTAAYEKLNENVLSIQIETSFVGTYEQIYQLFADLESLDRLIQVDKLSFNLKQGPLVQINAPGEPIISNLTLRAYYSPTLQALLKKTNDIDYTNSNGRTNPFN
jgi:hypothetical protein